MRSATRRPGEIRILVAKNRPVICRWSNKSLQPDYMRSRASLYSIAPGTARSFRSFRPRNFQSDLVPRLDHYQQAKNFLISYSPNKLGFF